MKSSFIAARPSVTLRLPATTATDYSAQVRHVSELMARAAIVVLFSLMAIRFATDFIQTGRITGLFLLVSEAVVVVLTVFRRSAISIDRSLRARVLTTVSLVGPPVLVPATVTAWAPEVLTVALSCAGLAIVIAGKVTLGRSFALLPANRGIVSSGVYRLVRHPIYMGYLVTHVAYLAANPSVWNIAALVVADVALMARAVCEEQTLARDPAYREYQTRVRWRVAPGVF
jgi:protein-S-isoprenylcysteine O-methyltransferase Ste14